MSIHSGVRLLATLVALILFGATRQADVVVLRDRANAITVHLSPSAGNIASAINVKGHDILTAQGIPFLAPWANRLDEPAFYANGKRYAFDMELGNVRGAIPIHGLLQRASEWQVVQQREAEVTSRLDFFRQPSWMKQWPFAHSIDITHRLENGVLEVRTRIENVSAEHMPIAIGFHPYFTLTDAPRDEWTIAVDARTRWLLASTKVPTGETEPIERLFPDPKNTRLKDHNLDDVFDDLVRDAQGRATMTVMGKSQQLDVVIGPKYRAMVIYAPAARNFICFEPMAGITNALNLAHKGIYKELQTVAPGGTWEESFWVRPKGFSTP
jgi:aldose 1-epimerase